MSELPATPEPGSPRDPWIALRARTPARILEGRAGEGYRTRTALDLRADHAFALDAVTTELDLVRDLGDHLAARYGLFEIQTCCPSRAEYLRRPDLGRRLSESSRARLDADVPHGADVQVAIGDGLSAAAVARQVPALLPRLEAECRRRGWTFGRPFFIRYCRVGVMNDIGEILDPKIAVLLIGERPGLATAESLSAYMAYRPRAGHTDAQRNLIANIHTRGVLPEDAATRIACLAELMRALGTSGVAVKEDLSAAARLQSPTAP